MTDFDLELSGSAPASERRVSIRTDVLFPMLLYAFRYALGRRSAAVTDVSEWIAAHKQLLTPWQRRLFVTEIDEAVERATALKTTVGDQCDQVRWLCLRDLLNNG